MGYHGVQAHYGSFLVEKVEAMYKASLCCSVYILSTISNLERLAEVQCVEDK
jgi:hypothetical protein